MECSHEEVEETHWWDPCGKSGTEYECIQCLRFLTKEVAEASAKIWWKDGNRYTVNRSKNEPEKYNKAYKDQD